MPRLIVRRATQADIAHFARGTPAPTLKAWVADMDGRLVAIGGLAFDRGRHFAFCDLTDEARPFRMHIMRTAIRVMAEAAAMGIRYVYAEADTGEPKAEAWLARLGFERDPRSKHYHRWDRKTWQRSPPFRP